MKTKVTRQPKIPDIYLEMIRQFPLRPIRNEAEYEAATAILDKHITADNPESGLADYVEVLVGLVGDYEDKHHSVDTSHITPLDSLKFLMSENDMTTADLGRLLGNSGLASMILHGKRGISKANAKILGKRFGLNPGAFI